MSLAVILRILGLLLMGFSVTLLPPIALSYVYADGEAPYYLITVLAMVIPGLLMWWPLRHRRLALRTRHGFLIVTLFWTVLGLISGVPFVISPSLHLSFTDAVFEAISGFTTTGATAIVGLDHLPKSLLYYRAQLHFLGGMGIIVLAVAIMPMLGVGGMALFRAETPGPMKDAKLTPRIAHTARALWLVYVALNVLCTLAFWAGGMSLFDAVCHAYGTIATGGFSNYDDSFAHFHSATLDAIADVFMFLGGVNFALHFLVLRDWNPKHYWRDSETRWFFCIVAGLITIVALTLLYKGTYHHLSTALRYSAFQVISLITDTGFTNANFSTWPVYVPILLMYIAFLGACAGSTCGGLKTIRVQLLTKQALREIRRLIHPRNVYPVKVGNQIMDEAVINGVWAFFALYAICTAVITMLLVGTGMDVLSAFSAVAAMFNNAGPGLGTVASNVASLPASAVWILSFTMLLGRLEIFTILVLLTPGFWQE